MSLFTTTTIECSECQTTSDFQAAGSVNADRRPDLRDDILNNSFQSVNCPSCDAEMRLEPLFNYLDMEFGLWLAAYPPRQITDFRTLEKEVQALFDESYGAKATPSAQEVGADLRPRLTFGWPATREKLLLRKSGLDDVSIEMLKLDLLRRVPEAPLQAGIELRVVDVAPDTLTLVWIDMMTEDVSQQIEVDRALLLEIEANPEGWNPIRTDLTKGMFVDMQKLYMGVGQDAA
ncbi:hypothetical protein GV827_17075 [Sulfitobacter sp. JBTF-M27]|uniref:CpXC domain-containing protein n=1 Tax=Sulfitobacter sediminilitoris TaxID=2698830 RepID=A0A6P0CD69_9RHOB|nr:CpXC domain-containing protein [Sulfitobacter sediminilitoris]NEK24102.1 hypothetical protein [Sulfitobacter sediminilitoris]